MEKKHLYTLEEINLLQNKKKGEITQSKERLQLLGKQLFAPHESKGKLDQFAQYVNTGIAAYDGIMTGIKVLRRIRSYFEKK